MYAIRSYYGCPVNVNIPDFIAKIAAGDIQAAYLSITDTNSLPAVCGRVCPQEEQCEQVCVLSIKGESVAIGRLERFAADSMMGKKLPQEKIEKNGIKAAVIGAGPAGLTCAGDLAKIVITSYSIHYTKLYEPCWLNMRWRPCKNGI